MRRANYLALFVGMSCVLPSIHEVVASPIECQVMAGSWSDVPGGSWNLQQDTHGAIQGTLTTNARGTCPSGQIYGITGATAGNGHVDLNGTYDTTISVRPSGCAATFTQSVTLLKPGCDVASGSWSNSANQVGTTTMTHTCDKPNGEGTPGFVGWADSEGYPTAGKWNTVLLPIGFNFGGRTVYESNGGPASDTCWKSGDPAAFHVTGVTGGQWDVDALSVWGSDHIGFSPSEVTYYHEHGRTPCGAAVTQAMAIDCSTGNKPYGVPYVLSIRITELSVTSKRAGAAEVSRIWGIPDSKLTEPSLIYRLLFGPRQH